METDEQPLYDPTPPKRQARVSCFKCVAVSVIVFVLAFVAFVAFLVAKTFWTDFDAARRPHVGLLHNASHSTLPVVPLVGRDTHFDVAVTVWLKPDELEIASRRQARLALAAAAEATDGPVASEGSSEGDGKEGKGGARELTDLDWEDVDSQETALFSGVVFRNLTLRSKHVYEIVDFTLPTSRFCGLNLSHTDLYASFVVLPSSPSLIDHATNFSEWIPADKTRLKGRPHPELFELRDQISESFRAIQPLVAFKALPEDPDAEEKPKAEESKTSEDDDVDDDGEAERIRWEKEAEEKRKKFNFPPGYNFRAKDKYQQPLVITRSQLRIIDDVSEYELKAYNKKHMELKSTGCDQWAPNKQSKRSRDSCVGFRKPMGAKTSGWEAVGPFGTRVTLSAPQEDGSTKQQRAYAPYIYPSGHAHSILDLVPLPVNRSGISKDSERNLLPLESYENCILRDSIDISWRVSFAGRTPSKAYIGDSLMGVTDPLVIAHNASDFARINQQDTHEILHGLAGHKHYPDSHPRVRLVLDAFALVIQLVLYFLDLHYWLTRSSTIGIAVAANLLYTLSTISFDVVGATYALIKAKNGFGEYFFAGLSMIIAWLPRLAALQVLLRVEVKWGKGWVPSVRVGKASHWERASVKTDRSTPVHVFAAVFAIVFVVYALFEPTMIHVIKSLLPLPGPDDISKEERFNYWMTVLFNAASFTFVFAQALMNHKSRTFAGRHRSATTLEFVRRIVIFARIWRVVVGRWDASPGWTVDAAFETAAAGMLWWQSVRLPLPVDGGSEE
ncbi:hypothetical protein MNV49_004875 [Pseudohyphozyma bogoriensis]|nr:hypothetical protein MNV49_004875 [Pseudohyphozyma bogoriensis]